MIVHMKDYEVACERRQDFIRHAQKANRLHTLLGDSQFGRTTLRTPFVAYAERVVALIHRHVDSWKASFSARAQHRYGQ